MTFDPIESQRFRHTNVNCDVTFFVQRVRVDTLFHFSNVMHARDTQHQMKSVKKREQLCATRGTVNESVSELEQQNEQTNHYAVDQDSC